MGESVYRDNESDIEKIYNVYDWVFFMSMKYSIVIPATLLGNVIDLCSLGFSKQLINVGPFMKSFPFWNEVTRDKENMIEDVKFFNQGFGGLLRAITTILTDLPITFISSVLATVATLLHVIISPILGGATTTIANNFC